MYHYQAAGLVKPCYVNGAALFYRSEVKLILYLSQGKDRTDDHIHIDRKAGKQAGRQTDTATNSYTAHYSGAINCDLPVLLEIDSSLPSNMPF